MKIDEYIDKHRDLPMQAVIEAIPGEPDRLRLTPIFDGHGCACDRSLTIDKSHIVDVEPTDRTVACCGKLRRVAKVVLHCDAQVPAADVIVSLFESATAAGPARSMRAPETPIEDEDVCLEQARSNWKRCVNGCGHASDPAACRARCRERLAATLELCSSAW